MLASGPPVESVPGPTRCCRDHSLQTWRSLKHEVNTIRCVLFMFSAIRRYMVSEVGCRKSRNRIKNLFVSFEQR